MENPCLITDDISIQTVKQMVIFQSKLLNCQRGIALLALLWQAEMPKLHFLALDCSWDAMDILSKFNFQAWLLGKKGPWLLDSQMTRLHMMGMCQNPGTLTNPI